jgi:putative phage-type endonuclease
MEKINELLKIPQYEQRSPEWFKQRENKLTSSDAATALGINPYQKSTEVLFKKCGHDLNPFVGNVATLHGQKYENEAIEKYCEITGQVNYNFGLIAHEDVYKNKDYYWLAGSPDGISLSKTDLNAKPILLEVKCPYRRVIKQGCIPEYYFPQVQLNMFICDLEIADFIEYRPPNEINIVRINRDELWLKENLKKLEIFWKEIEFYRDNDIKTHPKFPVKKKVLDLSDFSNLCIDNKTKKNDDYQEIILDKYSIKEDKKCKCNSKSTSKSNSKSNSNSNSTSTSKCNSTSSYYNNDINLRGYSIVDN